MKHIFIMSVLVGMVVGCSNQENPSSPPRELVVMVIDCLKDLPRDIEGYPSEPAPFRSIHIYQISDVTNRGADLPETNQIIETWAMALQGTNDLGRIEPRLLELETDRIIFDLRMTSATTAVANAANSMPQWNCGHYTEIQFERRETNWALVSNKFKGRWAPK